MQDSSSFRLIVRRGPQPNQVYELTQGVVSIGRDITNDIVINDPEVSRHHCRLTRGAGGYTVEDLGSTNGTFVNGQRLTGARPLSHGDTLGMGETVTLAYEAAVGVRPVDARQAPTMAGPQPGAEYAPQAPYDYAVPQQAAQPGAYPVTPPPQQFGAQPQPPVGYDYDYQEEPYAEAGSRRWVALGCGCFLVLCIVSSVIGGIIVDAKCWWDDIPVISDTFDLGVKPDATCR